MKVRAFLLYVALALLLVFLGAALVWPFLRVDERLRDLLIEEIDPTFAGAINLRRVHLGFGSLDLIGLEVRPESESWSLQTEKATIDFNLLRFITHGFRPQSALTSISIYSPTLQLRSPVKDSLRAEQPKQSPGLQWTLLDNVPEIFWEKKAEISSGTVHLLTSSGEILLTLENLNVSVSSGQKGRLEGHLQSAGRGLQSIESDLWLSLDAKERKLESSLRLKAESLRFGKALGLPDSVNLTGTGLNADLRLWVTGPDSRCNGEIQLARAKLENGTLGLLEGDSARFEISDWKLWMPPWKVRGLTADWDLSGQIADLRHPELDFSVGAHAVDCSALDQWMPRGIGFAPAGKLDLQAEVKGSLKDPAIYLQGELAHLRTKLEAFSNVLWDADLIEKRLTVHRLSARGEAGNFLLQGQATLGSRIPAAQAAFQWEGRLPGSSRAASGILRGEFSADEVYYRLKADWRTAETNESPLLLEAEYSTERDALNGTLKVPNTTANVQLKIDRLSGEPKYNLRFDAPQMIFERMLQSRAWDKLRDLQISGEVFGPADRIACRLLVLNEKIASRLKLDGSLRIHSATSAAFSGDVMLRQGSAPPLEGQFALSLDDSILSLGRLELDNTIAAYGELNLETGEIGPTELRMTNWPLSRGLQIFLPEMAAQWGMVLDGRLELFGNIKEPGADLSLYASQGYFQERGNFWAVLSAQLENNRLTVSECNLGQGILSLLRLHGYADLNESTLSFQARSDLADAGDLMELLGGNPARVHGPLKLQAEIGGTFSQPDESLMLTMSSGSIYKVPFDSLRAVVRSDSSTDHALTVKEFQLVQAPDLSLEAHGTLPFAGRPLDLQLLLKGNILKIVHQIEPDILESGGQGELLLELAQRQGKVQLANGSLELRDGRMRFPQVVSEIRALNAKLHCQGNRFLIDDLTGEVGGQGFRVSNYFDSANRASDLEHLYFPGADMDLGVITVETAGRGLYCHIPALMPSGVKSYVGLNGKNGNAAFTISGPIDKPLFSGTITVANAVFDYPFPPGKGGRPSRFVRGVLNVLSSARWDLVVVPQRDNSYAHEVKALDSHTVLGDVSELLTTVDVSLNVDPGDSKLQVVGCLNDGNFRFVGRLVSTSGSVEYLDFNFRVERFEAEFDEYDPLPMVQGRASTVYVDSLGFSHTIYATLYMVDPVTGERKQRGRWGDFVFVLEDDRGSSQEQILAAMGYSPGTITEKARSLGGTIVSGMVLRGFVRPIERELESLLQVDVIRLQPTLAQNLFETEVLGAQGGPISQIGWGAYMLRQSQLTVGKYLTNDLFLSYTGLWKTGINATNERHFGFLHRWNLDYRIRPVSGNLVLTFGYEYDSLELLEDKKVALRYSFVF